MYHSLGLNCMTVRPPAVLHPSYLLDAISFFAAFRRRRFRPRVHCRPCTETLSSHCHRVAGPQSTIPSTAITKRMSARASLRHAEIFVVRKVDPYTSRNRLLALSGHRSCSRRCLLAEAKRTNARPCWRPPALSCSASASCSMCSSRPSARRCCNKWSTMSAFGRLADVWPRQPGCPLMTRSGHPLS